MFYPPHRFSHVCQREGAGKAGSFSFCLTCYPMWQWLCRRVVPWPAISRLIKGYVQERNTTRQRLIFFARGRTNGVYFTWISHHWWCAHDVAGTRIKNRVHALLNSSRFAPDDDFFVPRAGRCLQAMLGHVSKYSVSLRRPH